MFFRSFIFSIAVVVGALWWCNLAIAAPDEIVVFTDEFAKKGEVDFSVHLNYAPRARCTQEYPREQIPCKVFRAMPEVVWGLTETWNFAVHVPLSYSRNTTDFTLDGIKLRLHNLTVRESGKDNNFFYGANYELTAYNARISESRYNAELRGIIGTTRGEWKYTLNPILASALSKNPNGRTIDLELLAQVMRSFNDSFALGIEHYASPGKARDPRFNATSGEISYLVTEFKTKNHFHVHVGVGHGWTSGSDKLVFKALISTPFH